MCSKFRYEVGWERNKGTVQWRNRWLTSALFVLYFVFCQMAEAEVKDDHLVIASEAIVSIQLKRNTLLLIDVLHEDNLKEAKDRTLKRIIARMKEKPESYRTSYLAMYNVKTVKELKDMDPAKFQRITVKREESYEDKRMMNVSLKDYKITKKTHVSEDEVNLEFTGTMNYKGAAKPFSGKSGFKKQDGKWKLYFKDLDDYKSEKGFEALNEVDDFVRDTEIQLIEDPEAKAKELEKVKREAKLATEAAAMAAKLKAEAAAAKAAMEAKEKGKREQ